MTDGYRPTEAKYKGGADEMCVTYDLDQRTRGGKQAEYPKVKRVYIAGDVTEWQPGVLRKRTGREVHGVRIAYEQRRAGYRRRRFTASRGGRRYGIEPSSAKSSVQRFVQVVELPSAARNVHFYPKGRALPERYHSALQRIR